MMLLTKKESPTDQKCNALYFILFDQWFNLIVHDMRTALVNTGLDNHESQTPPNTYVMTLGRLAIHRQVIALSRIRSTPRKLQKVLWLCQKTINFHWILSKYFLSEMLSKHRDLLKILPITENDALLTFKAPC